METFKEKMSRLGRKGGKKSRRVLTTKQAKEMVNKRWRKKNGKEKT